MKKKIIIPVIVGLILVAGIISFIILNGRVAYTISLDINPSIEINLTKRNKVKSIIALNEDAKQIVSDKLNGKTLDDTIKEIANKSVEKGFVKEGEAVVIIHSTGNFDNGKLENTIKNSFNESNVSTDVIVVENISAEDEALAKKYNISAAKASYINSVLKENENVAEETLVEKPVKEIKEIKETGNYCDQGYTLSGDFCERVVREEDPISGKTCPDGYEDINGKCNKTKDFEETPYCQGSQTLQNGKCVGEVSTDAKAKCTKGEYNSKTGKCEELTLVGEGTKKCKNSDDYLLENGKCAYAHMGAHFDDPEGTIDPATECCCGDFWVADSSVPGRGWCYSPAGNYDPTVTCKSGQTVKDGKCYTAESSDPTYYCEGNAKLEGNKCVENKSVNPSYKRTCSDGYKLYENRICVNYNDNIEYITGNTCNKEARLINNKCVYYEVIDAKHN